MSKSLAYGAPLTQSTFADFVERLRYDCKGERVNDHCTADAFFLVQHKDRVCGLDAEYSDKRFILDSANHAEYESPKEWFDALEEEGQDFFNQKAQDESGADFLDLFECDQWDMFANDEIEDHSVVYYQDEWKTINHHFTYDAAEAFIKRKGHDYGELRVYADAHTYGWEYNAIKQALLDGSLMFVGMPKEIETERCSPAQSRAGLVATKAWSDAGISFVPVPVFGEDDTHAFAGLALDRANALVVALEANEARGQGGDV